MSALAPTLQAFFTQRLTSQRHASSNTVAAYRDAWRLLLRYAQDRTGKQPCLLDLADLDAPFVAGFLDHLEQDRGNSVRTRNARLAAIRSFFRYAALCHPEHAGLIARVLAIPAKRAERTELTGLRNRDVELGAGAHLNCTGKGRKRRATPLRKQTAAVVAVWMKERGGGPDDPVFPTRRGTQISRGAVARLVARHAAVATRYCPSPHAKRVTPHVLRHSCAMSLLAKGVDTAVIALWLGHEGVETTQIYVHADMSIKERALARTAPPNTTPGRYQPPDSLLAFLTSL